MRVVAAISIENRRVLCCRRSAAKQHGGLWEFPGGKVELGETDQSALIREISEELSQTVTVKDYFLSSQTSPDSNSLELHTYFVSGIALSVSSGDSHSEVRWVPIE